MVLRVSPAAAADVTVAGFTNGCFGVGCTPAKTNAPYAVSLLGFT